MIKDYAVERSSTCVNHDGGSNLLTRLLNISRLNWSPCPCREWMPLTPSHQCSAPRGGLAKPWREEQHEA